MDNRTFKNGEVYEDVYFIFVDAANHSSIVNDNPKDIAEQAFDLFYERINTRLKRVASKHRCDISVVWSWLGDGGIVAIYDSSEKTAISTTFEFVFNVMKLDLPSLQSEFKSENITGELHMRIAVTKSTIKYTSNECQGFIHSIEINRGAHLEKATLADSVAITSRIYEVLSKEIKNKFVFAGIYENEKIYLHSDILDSKKTRLYWILKHGFSSVDTIQCYSQRISQTDKAELINLADDIVIDFGTTLHTCSNYLYSTERPLSYKEAVCNLLKRGGRFICYMLEPGSEGAKQLVELRKEDTDKKLNESMRKFARFKTDNHEIAVNFKIYQCEHNPNLAAMVIDPKSENGVCLYSPYLNVLPNNKIGTGRADMPHYLVSKKNDSIYTYIMDYINLYISESTEFILNP